MKEISFSYNSSLKRLRVFKGGKLLKEITGDAAKASYIKIIKK